MIRINCEIGLLKYLDRFPNLERLSVTNPWQPQCSKDQDVLGELCCLSQLRLLELDMEIRSNFLLFNAFRYCPKFHSLRMTATALSFDDCKLLAETAPCLKTLDLSVDHSSCSVEGYALLVGSLTDLQTLLQLHKGVLSLVTQNLQLLNVQIPSRKDMEVIVDRCPNLTVLFLGRLDSPLLLPAIIGPSLKCLAIRAGEIHPVPIGVRFPNLIELTMYSCFGDYDTLISNDSPQLCVLFPNLEFLDIFSNELTDSTVDPICRDLKNLKKLRTNKGSLDSEDIEHRRRQQSRVK
jgi:hypothetical protein